MKSKIIICFLLICNFFTNAQTTNIPDINFEQQLIDLGIDTNGLNGNILNADAQAVTNLNITSNTITNFIGLEAFVNLLTLNLGSNQFATVPLTNLTVLEELIFRDNDVLTALDLSQNTALIKIDIGSVLYNAVHPPITGLDLSQNLLLEDLKLGDFQNMGSLIIPITNTLKKIDFYYLATPTIDLSLLDGLEDFKLSQSAVSVDVIFPNEQNILKKVNLSAISFITVDLSNYLVLERLDLYSTHVENLILPTTTTFTYLTIQSHNFILPLSLAAVPNLSYLSINNNETVPLVIDITNNLLLDTIWLTNNNLASIDLSQNTLLRTLYIYNNNLITIDLTQNVIIENLNASHNQIPTIDLSQNSQLKYLTLSNNLFPTIDVTNNIALNNLDISSNLFTTTGFDLSQNIELHYLNASNNEIESLDISNNIELVSLVIHHNLFSGTDILDQLFIIKTGYFGVSASNIIDVSFNQLSGTMPDFASLVSAYTNFFRFRFNDNAFEFGDFENQHNQYVQFLSQTNTFGGSELPIMTAYLYAPQAKVNNIENLNENAGTNITLTTIVRGMQNHYKWFKNGVEIVDAPDSPEFIITDLNSCDEGVYYCEITSDLVPFENSDPPGTNNKNLLLVRNDINLIVNYTETCVSLTDPINGSTNVPINTGLTWTDSLGACGYNISVGTTSGGNDIINNLDVGEVTFYNFTSNLPINTEIFVTITPYFLSGNILTCNEESFTTGTSESLPNCTQLTTPADLATNVSIATNLTWNIVSNSDGYYVSIGTSSGATDILNNFDVVGGSSTMYNPTIDFNENTTYYVNVIAYNLVGNATGCSETSFTTETITAIPNCTQLNSPVDTATSVATTTDLTWSTITNADGYYINIGTLSGGTNVLSNFNIVGATNTTYNPTTNFNANTTYFVTIIAYNSLGNAIGCSETSFTTGETTATIPICTQLTSPADTATNVSILTNLTWTAVGNADGYYINFGTISNGTDIENNTDLGNVTTYNLINNLLENTTYYVTIIAYNASGNAINCDETSFTTETIATIPICTQLTFPANTATNVSISTDLTWTAVGNADGYYITIGTTHEGTDVEDELDLGNTLIYNISSDWLENTTYYVTITAYNASGNAINCTETSFTTETIATIPICAQLTSPADTATNVSISTDLTWTAIDNADGYYITIGTAHEGTDIEDELDLGNTLIYNISSDWLENTTYYVTITAYNAFGNAINCTETNFLTTININIDYMPFFTPNNNGENDVWQIQGEGILPGTKVNIFDRYGKLVAQLDPFGLGWNGNYHGKPLPSSDYWFVVKLINGSEMKGNFSLLRN